MKIASRATPEGLAGHGLSTTVLRDCMGNHIILPVKNINNLINLYVCPKLYMADLLHYRYCTILPNLRPKWSWFINDRI